MASPGEPMLEVLDSEAVNNTQRTRQSSQVHFRGHGGGEQMAYQRGADTLLAPDNMTSDSMDESNGSHMVDSVYKSDENSVGISSCKKEFLKYAIGVVLCALVLGCTVLSKLTLFSLVDQLRNFTHSTHSDSTGPATIKINKAVTLYWQLLLVLVLPHCVTFLRCLVFGVLWKTDKSFPWPTTGAILLGMLFSLLEVCTMSTFVFLVLVELPTGIGIFLLNGVSVIQILLDWLKTKPFTHCCKRKRCQTCVERGDYHPLRNEIGVRNSLKTSRKLNSMLTCTCVKEFSESCLAKTLALASQVLGISALFVSLLYNVWHAKCIKKANLIHPLCFPLVLIFMSIIWCHKCQNRISKTRRKDEDDSYRIRHEARHEARHAKGDTARYKSSFINSIVRIILFPFVTYATFRYATSSRHIDPWCLRDDCPSQISLQGDTLPVMLVQILTTLFGYLFTWVACTMTLSQLGMAIPLLLSTPITAIWYYIDVHYFSDRNLFPTFQLDNCLVPKMELVGSVCVVLLYIGQLLAFGYFLYAKENVVLAKDTDMFLTPHYDGVFLEQHMILNRQIGKYETDHVNGLNDSGRAGRHRRTIFVCSTMYHENETEMKQMLTSIRRVADYYEKQKRNNPDHNAVHDHFESHIFFDGAIIGTQLQHYGLQLLSLLRETLGVKLNECLKIKTPYGYKFSWSIGMEHMPFSVHFKDKNKVKPKKRWSQVMYMSYVKWKVEQKHLDPANTFILTTDADIDFTAESAVVLLDMLASNPKVAAVCARTHPKGSGPLYWYQVFDYAIGHWFQKPAEHILGCVLCSPGCFSVFRCSALNEVLKEYSSEAKNASEFLMKDMGEDRWLCTLLIKKGWRLEYCAISEDYTYCPEEFSEFYKQRRRWIPSTMANLATLITEFYTITKNNDSISILFILFQAIMVFSTAISPATVILIISSGIQSAYKISIGATYAITILLILLSVLYGLICLFASQQTQIDVARVLTFVFSLVMAVVLAGIIKGTVESLYPGPKKILLSIPNCDDFDHSTKDYQKCLDGARIAADLANGLYKPKRIPVSTSILYSAALAVTFGVAAVLHPYEFWNLLHGIWYLLALPSGYLLLLIYSAANLNSTSWGTRERSNSGKDKGLLGWFESIIQFFKKCSRFCLVRCCKRLDDKDKDEKKESTVEPIETVTESDHAQSSLTVTEDSESEDPYPRRQIRYKTLDSRARKWLRDIECECYASNFEDNGYTNLRFIADMSPEDFRAIKIDKKGFMLRLQKAAQKLQSLQLQKHTMSLISVQAWLNSLEMEEYTDLFHSEGYKTRDDIEHLKDLDEKQLKAMGIEKRAHLQRFTCAIERLIRPSSEHKTLDDDTIRWLKHLECERYARNFEHNGYTNLRFIAAMSAQDFRAIGIDSKGFMLRLLNAAQKLPSLRIKRKIPKSVQGWLKSLEMEEYTDLFHSQGYKTGDDIENLKDLDETQLQAMGITKRAHLHRLLKAIEHLIKPSEVDRKIRDTKSAIDEREELTLDGTEAIFWEKLNSRSGKLKPISERFVQVNDLKSSLASLRNVVLAVLLLVNIMWIVLLFTLNFSVLVDYGLDPRGFQLLFLAVYAIIIFIQFIALVCHRVVTLIHYLGRIKQREVRRMGNLEFTDVNISQAMDSDDSEMEHVV